ncbi:endo-dextranase [Flavitalea flava]
MSRASIFLMICWLAQACAKSGSGSVRNPVTPPLSDTVVSLTTDKACYRPGDQITITIDKNLPVSAKFRVWKLDKIISEIPVTGKIWNWTAPSSDFMGYMVEVCNPVAAAGSPDGTGGAGGAEKRYGCIAVDVSSDWSRFPRYGFLSAFGQIPGTAMAATLADLNRYHLNGIQFQDWEYAHHLPLAGTVASPAATWKDIANRDNYASTVRQYIDLAHGYNMKAMTYNLCYGALSDAASAGIPDQWYLYTDRQHTKKEVNQLPKPPFKSDIYLLDPSSPDWQQYIVSKTSDVYSVYDFDGYQVDQLGDRSKNLYAYDGSLKNPETGFGDFLAAMKKAAPSKRLVMNAVNQYGQQMSIAKAPVDFLYTEVWSPNEDYKDLAAIIQQNDAWSNYTQKTVLAAYMDYNLAESPGYFNTPGVLLTDAVIFAFGASHLELGEHMLGKEYFPNGNLSMKNDLQKAMVNYYDFLVAYQHLLRDGGQFNTPGLTSTDGKMMPASWPPKTGAVSFIGKDMGTAQVIHLINFASASGFDWRDTNGKQTVPAPFQNTGLTCTVTKQIKKIWFASPDIAGGLCSEIPFTQTGHSVSFLLPALFYWDMLVLDYE